MLLMFRHAAATGVSNAISDGAPAPNRGFLNQLGHSADVFSAFKTHSQQKELGNLLTNDKGKLRSFADFQKASEPLIGKYNKDWLRTEYNTTVRRSSIATNWQQYEAEKDVMPCLEWIESTSPNPGADHSIFWGTIQPVDAPFWNEHCPGDRYNCQCPLEQTDKAPTVAPKADSVSVPQPGLDNNPGRDGKLFNESHPYYPKSCSACPFSGNKLMALYHDLADDRDCHNCKAANNAINKTDTHNVVTTKSVREYKSGGALTVYDSVDKSKTDYKALKKIGDSFAKKGDNVVITPRVNFKSPFYKELYGNLIGTIYERKCPDISINGRFYEFEGYIKPWKKDKVGAMLSHGAKQSSYIIIDNNKGASDRYIKSLIHNRLRDKNFKEDIQEVWLYEKGEVRMLFKKQKER